MDNGVRRGNRQWVAAALLALIVIILGGLRMTPYVAGVYHDDGIYVATAKSLAEGRGYRLINLPGEPAQTKYPILYPAVLSSIWMIWPEYPANLIALQAVSLLSAAAAIALSYLYLVRNRFAGEAECLAAGVLCATSPTVLYFATQTLSEMLFSLLLILSLWSLEFTTAAPARRAATSAVTGIASALPFLCRSVGVCVPPIALWDMKRRSIPMAPTLIAAAVTIAPWLIWLALRKTPSTGGPLDYYTADNYISWWFTDAWARVPALNALQTCIAIVMIPLAGLVEIAGWFWPAFLAAGALAFRETFRTFRTPMVLTASVYLTIVLLWPWPPARFLIPWLPLLTVFVILGAKRIFAYVPRRGALAIARTAFIVAILANLLLHFQIVRIVKETGYPFGVVPERVALWKHYDDMFEWIRNNTPASAIVASGLDSMVFLHTGRRGFRPFAHHRPTALFYGSRLLPLGTAEEFVRVLARGDAQYLLELPMPGFGEEAPLATLIAEARTRWPGCLRAAYTVAADPRFTLYQLDPRACLPDPGNQ